MNQPAITIITPPATEPVALAEAKAWAKIDVSDDDTLVTNLIAAAREAAELYMKRSIITQTRKLTADAGTSGFMDALPAGIYDLPVSVLTGSLPRSIELPYSPLQSVTSIVTYSTAGTATIFSSSAYYVDTASSRVTLNDGQLWPSDLRDRKSMEITFVAGYGTASDVPMAIKTAIMIHVQSMYDARIVCDMPKQCETLLQRYRIYG